MPTEAPSAASASARLTAVVDLPTPPFDARDQLHAALHGVRHHFGAHHDRRAGCARLLERLDHLAPDRLDLALARIAELELDRDLAAIDLHGAHRARRDEILAGVRVDELREDRADVRIIQGHARSVS